MYIFEAPRGWDDFRRSARPPQKEDARGNLMFERYPRPTEPGKPTKPQEPLLNFSILPDVIGTQEQWWYFEAIRRIDPRIRWIDITMRMPLDGRPSENSLNQDGVRNRPKYGMRSWFPKKIHQTHNARRDTAIAILSQAQIALNTTRGTTPGLINPELGEAGGRVPYPAGRKGQGVRRGPRKKPSLEISENEADDEESEIRDRNDQIPERKVLGSPTESIRSRVKPIKATHWGGKRGKSKEWKWVGDTLYDSRGLGKSRPPGGPKPKECETSATVGRKRKVETDDGERAELPRKKRIIDWLPTTSLHSQSFHSPRYLLRNKHPLNSTSARKKATSDKKPYHRYDWHSISHAAPYDDNSYVSRVKLHS